ncbi:MAG: T9SS type A sorting domain-containing protein, partial [Fibrobacteres bacterium]|nr:T9SS type A sorting domain-containing protein [Fibrobacterota bacterium]
TPQSLVVIPNPFNPSAFIRLPAGLKRGYFTLKVFDVKGKMVRDLTNRVVNDCALFDGTGLATGTYVLRLAGTGKSKFVKLELIR